MTHRAILQRIFEAVDREDYLVPVARVVDPAQRRALTEVVAILGDPLGDASRARSMVYALQRDGQLDPVTVLSALGVIAASPKVRDYAEAARLASEQEFLALELGGAQLSARLASADRHRGVIAYLMGHPEVALDWFTRALERERTGENLGNVLCALIRLDDLDAAWDLLSAVREGFPGDVVVELDRRIRVDADLGALRG